jgi:hypothetical protein
MLASLRRRIGSVGSTWPFLELHETHVRKVRISEHCGDCIDLLGEQSSRHSVRDCSSLEFIGVSKA